jgi:hypothetical protein
MANKQDLEDALEVDQLKTELALHEEEGRRPIKIQGSSALLNKGLEEGFKWLVNRLTDGEDEDEEESSSEED